MYDANQIIPITTLLSGGGLGYANFASAFFFAPNAELPQGFAPDTVRVYNSLPDLEQDFPSTTETYQANNRWLGGIPFTQTVTVWGVDANDATITDTLNKARNRYWWFFSFFDAATYADTAKAEEIAQWGDANGSFIINCQTGPNAAAIRDINVTDDIATILTTAGYRFTATFAHATDPYAGIALCKWFASTNYSLVNTTITGEFKKLAGVTAESLSGTEYAAMTSQTKRCAFYSQVDLQGSIDAGRCLNTYTHSPYKEFMDDVINLAAFTNRLTVDRYNALANQPTKLGQDPIGQAVLDGAAKNTCEQFIANGYLGPRNYLDPDDGVEKYVTGYQILTKPEDILNLTDAERQERLAAPLKIRIFRKGAIHKAPVTVEVI